MKVIFNADDFGLCKGQNEGIIKAYEEGVVRSATLMVNMPGTAEAVEYALRNKNLKVGVHISLTAGKSLLEHVHITRNGIFLKKDYTRKTNEQINEIEKEVRAQIEKFFSFGLELSHIDSHHHFHWLPQIYPIFEEVAKEYNVPLRKNNWIQEGHLNGVEYKESDLEFAKTLPEFTSEFYGDSIQVEDLIRIIEKYNRPVEIMCHPAILDDYIKTNSSYNKEREIELETLCSNELKEYLKVNNIEVSHY
jgi:predicted glycoside hydrolase/deacetylase ChbG (UPF0249 family)